LVAVNDRSKLIRQAIEGSFDVLGERTKRALIEDLERYGVYLDAQEIDLTKLVQALKEIMGDEASNLILEQLNRKLRELERRHRR
jgi:hypothetical protein